MTDTLDPKTPILIGAAQFTQRTAREKQFAESLNPMELLAKAARGAVADTGAAAALAAAIDTVAVVGFTADAPLEQGRLVKRLFRNPPASLATHLGAKPRRTLYTGTGGNTPQWLVNRTAAEIASGACDVALLAGAEYLATFFGALSEGLDLGWSNSPDADPGSDPEMIGDDRPGTSAYERAYGLQFPVNTYALFENAIRGAKGRSAEDHLKWMGQFFSRFSKVAADNPYAWFKAYRSPEEISTPGPNNRFVGFPYTKYLNAMIAVDMSAALVMTSVQKARELGIARDKWVFLHGCADANDIWNVTARVDLHSSPALKLVGKKAFAMAGRTAAELDYIDLYSCFPSAVEVACQELGIAEDDPRGLTITGGLPYFGGPGNNYVMHAIATMMEKVRGKPGSFGLCTGNGWYLTKHSAGIYSTTPTKGAWKREDPKGWQKDLDAMAHPEVEETPEGKAKVETYTIVTDRKGRRFGIVVGRLESGHRFLANTPDDKAILDWIMREEMLGRVGDVGPTTTINLFRFR